MTTQRAESTHSGALVQRYQALLDIGDAIHACREPDELFKKLAECLRRVIAFDAIAVVLQDEEPNMLRLALLESWMAPPVAIGHRVPRSEVPGGWVIDHQQLYRIRLADRDSQFPRYQEGMRRSGIRVAFLLPLTTSLTRLGVMSLAFKEDIDLPDSELQFMQRVADQVAVAIENASNLERIRRTRLQTEARNKQRESLLQLTNNIVMHLDLQEVLRSAVSSVRQIVPCDLSAVALPDEDERNLLLMAMEFPECHGALKEGLAMPMEGSNVGRAFKTGQAVILDCASSQNYSPQMWRVVEAEGLKSQCFVPLLGRGRSLGVLGMSRREERPFSTDEIDFLKHVAAQISMAVENAIAYREITCLKDRLALEKLYLEGEIRSEKNFAEIVGGSESLQAALERVQTVANSDSTVLILGETGTGKELVARAIHEASRRKGRTFVKLNCAAIPTGLLESELFGHERGAFTGAIAQKIGRMELANGGTLFLDEVGDIPLELQPKLLRALQEREFERLGSVRTQKSDVRFLAATNRDLPKMVAEKEFRSDLFYRLNVFPIQIPALRDRREDIPRLVRYFVSKYAKKMDKRIESIPSAAMAKLQEWHWPGNVRELENFMERSVILTTGAVLHVPVTELESQNGHGDGAARATLRDTERERILQVLRDTNWVLAGPSGAAARLGVKRTTLQYKIKKLGITRDSA